MTSLTLLTLAVIVYGMANRGGYGRALALGGATTAGAALVAGGVALPTFYAVALGAAVALALDLLGHGRGPARAPRRLPPGVPILLAFLGWSAFVTLVSPIVFDGTAVMTPAGSSALRAGAVTPSNVAQIVYLVLGIVVVVFLARSPRAVPQLIGLAVGLTTLLSFWRYLYGFGVPFPEGLFDNSPFYAYIDMAPGGLPRFRGILTEPAGLAASSLMTISYMVARARQTRGARRVGVLLVAAVAAFLGSISTSATFVVAGVVVAAIAAVTFTLGFLRRRVRVGAGTGVLACVAIVGALWLLPVVAGFVEATVDAKVGSSSYNERSGFDGVAYEALFQTFGVGTGLGATRASSFLAGLLGTTGVVGTALFGSAVALLVLRAAPVRAYRPVVWALLAALVLKAVAGPDLSDPSGVVWMSLGLLSHAALHSSAPRHRADHPVGPAVSTIGDPRA